MARRIQILPDNLINQIAAGEVVERPASVVKELVENALDAGATRIEVSIRNGGKTEIRVSDDGHGMGREDALLALDRHATSKITHPDDLASVRTLGFRGEALPSIGAVSRLVLETAERDGDATRVQVSGGRIGNVESCARRRGTTVTVRSLFFNVAARAKFLRSAAAEARAVSEVVTNLVLANPAVAFQLESNGKDLLDLPPAAELRGRIAGVWGDALADQLIPIAHRADSVTVTGLVQRPHHAGPTGRRAYLFVNGRWFSNRHLVRAADRAYQTTIAPGMRPSLFLFLDIPDGRVDVNVHPSKAEVRFREGIAVEQAIEDAVRSGLQPLHSAPGLGSPADYRWSPSDPPQPRSPDAFAGGNGSGDGVGAAPPRAPQDQMSLFVTGGGPEADGTPATELTRVQPILWQLHNTYILAETRSGLIIVDQHSAHERVLYEELMQRFAEGEVASQRLLFPLTLRLSPAEHSVVEELTPLFRRIGFEIEPFGGRSVIVHSVPNPHPYFDSERCLREMIFELAEGSALVDAARNQHQRIALSYACKAAIKAGQPLSAQEASELFDRLFATELPYHDIHGRPTVVQLSITELHNRFRRSG